MADRKEERERLRRERLEAERRGASDERRRLILGYAVAGILGALVLAGIVVAIMNAGGGVGEHEPNEAAGIDPDTGETFEGTLEPDEREGTEPPDVELAELEEAAEAADCELQLDLEDQGATHIADDAEAPEYKTNPPTSGDHSPNPLADGAYLDQAEAANALHSLEHGRVGIQYDSGLSEDEQLALKGVFDDDPEGMHMFPNDKMPYAVAAVSWTNLMGCDSYSPEVLDAVRAFRDEFRGQGPEDVPL